jgi:hypothetical protein
MNATCDALASLRPTVAPVLTRFDSATETPLPTALYCSAIRVRNSGCGHQKFYRILDVFS